MTSITLPKRPMGRPTAAVNATYERDLQQFCEEVKELTSTLDFRVSSRGWCYILEEHELTKDDFDTAQKLINDCRKSGLLPLDICKEDDARAFDNLEKIDDEAPEEFARDWVEYLDRAHLSYCPISFWRDQAYYVEMLVEKIDLKSLFSPVCAEFYLPIANVGGWADIGVRAEIMRRFKQHERHGRQCVLLYCGDHDPGGLNISEFLHSNLNDLAQAVNWRPNKLIIERFGLDNDFIAAQGLTWIENLHTSKSKYSLDDPKHPDHNKPYVQNYLKRFGARKVEANALVVRPDAGRALCRSAILRYVRKDAPKKHWRELGAMRELVRQHIARLMNEWSQP